jgi:hypothetical protein
VRFCENRGTSCFPGQKLALARAFRVKYDQNYGFGIEDVLYNPIDECTFLVPLYEDDMLAFFQTPVNILC